MPSSYSFLTFSDVDCMRNKSAKAQIRKHAMKDIGFSRRRDLEDLKTQPPAPVDHSRRPRMRLGSKPSISRSSKAVIPDQEDHLPLWDGHAVNSPRIRALGCTIDPFDTASVPLDGATVDLLKYFAYYSSHMPTSFVFLPNALVSIREALEDELVLHCLLSAAASRADYVQGLQLVHFKQKEVTCTQKGLETLQERLKTADVDLSPSIVRLITGMLYLGAAALYRDDAATAKVHIRFAIKLAELRGGMSRIPDPQLIMRALGLDDLLACRELIPCSMKCTFDPGPSPYPQPERKNDHQVDEDCSAAALFANDALIFSEPLIDLTSEVLGTLRVKRKVEGRSHMLCGQALGERQWLVFKTLAIRNRLLAFSPINTITNALRIALILFTLLPPCDSRQGRTAQLVAKRLMSVLCEISRRQWLSHEGLRFWCLLIGYFSVFGADEGAAAMWYTVEIWQMIEADGAALGVSARTGLLDDLVAFQREYLFHESRQRSMTERLAHDLQQHGVHSGPDLEGADCATEGS